MEVMTVSQEQALATQRMEIDMQVATAKQYPRDLKLFQKNCETMIAYSPEVAAACNYSLTKGGKIITGPSIRLAEIILSNWGNMRAAARVLGHDGKNVSVQAVCHDLESNVKIDVEVQRRITDKHGKTYRDDMIQTTTSAAVSIGIRNALFKVVPNIFTQQLSELARKNARGKKDDFSVRIANAIEHFNSQYGVPEDIILGKLGVTDKRKLNNSHLDILLGLATGLRDGQTTAENEFSSVIKEPQPGEKKKAQEKEKPDKVENPLPATEGEELDRPAEQPEEESFTAEEQPEEESFTAGVKNVGRRDQA